MNITEKVPKLKRRIRQLEGKLHIAIKGRLYANFLTSNDKYFKIIAEQELMPLFVIQEDHFKYFNQAACRLTGYTSDFLQKFCLKDLPGLIHPEDREFVVSQYQHSTASDAYTATRYMFRFKGGKEEYLWVDIWSNPILYEGKDSLMVALIDITELKRNEIALRESEEQYMKLVNASPDAIVVTDAQGYFLFISPKTINIFGYKLDTDYRRMHMLDFIVPEEREVALQNTATIISHRSTLKKEYTLIRKDGSLFFGEIHSTAINDYKGNPKGMISVIRDTTDRKMSEDLLLKAKKKAEESDKLKSAFLANMSHEIRTPMNAILGFANLLDDSELSEKKRKEYISIISSNGNTLLTLIDDIIDVAKIEAGELKIRRHICNPKEIIQDLKSSFEEQLLVLQKNNIEVTLGQMNPQTCHLITDPARFRQILSNLVNNAIKFTRKGSVEIGFYEKRQGEMPVLVFYVKDSGIGIKKDDIPLIFERFRQLDSSSTRQHGGTGLGLSITKNLVELLGGKIWVESKIGKGSTFFFTLPFKGNQPVKPEHKEPDEEESLPEWNNRVILVAEDEYANYYYLKEILQKTGTMVIHAANGKTAVEMCRINPDIDLVLMDIKMPGMSGFEATLEIKKFRPHLPVIAQTAYAMEEERDQCLKSGCDDYISKPIREQQLIQKISSLLQ